MSRRTIVIIGAVLAAAGAIALVVWFVNGQQATGAVVQAAVAQGAEPHAFRSGQDLASAQRLHRQLMTEIAAMLANGQTATPRWTEAHAQVAALRRLYPSLGPR